LDFKKKKGQEGKTGLFQGRGPVGGMGIRER
jgi:hypothetical protein